MSEELKSKEFKKFWEQRASKASESSERNIANLEDDQELYRLKVSHEITQVNNYIDQFLHNNNSAEKKLLDLGTGQGFWAFELQKHFKKIVGVDFCDQLIDAAKKLQQRQEEPSKFNFLNLAAEDYKEEESFDLCLISGLLIYLTNTSLQKLFNNINSYTTKGSYVILRDGTGIQGQYEINNRFSKELNEYYSAIYRTSEEYIHLFKSIGFECVEHQDMFPEGHVLNKFPETRLRLYLFRKI